MTANGSGASFCSEGNVLESQWWWLPSTVNVAQTAELYALQNGSHGELDVL